MTPAPGVPRKGTYQRDDVTGKVGRVIEYVSESRVLLRPPDGTPDVEASVNDLEPVGTYEALRLTVKRVDGVNREVR